MNETLQIRGSRTTGALSLSLCVVFFTLPISIAAAQMGAGISLFLGLVLAVREPVPRRRPLLYGIPFALFAVVVVFAASFGWRPELAVPKLHRLLWLALLFVVPAAARRAGGDPMGMIRRFAWALVAGTTVRGLYDLVAIPPVFWRAPAGADWKFLLFSQGSMRTPQFYMVALCFLLAIAAVGRAASRRGTLAWIGLTLVNAAGLILHFKRGAWFAFAGAAAIVALSARRWRVLAIIAMVAAGAVITPAGRARLESLRQDQNKPGSRIQLWKNAAPYYIRKCPGGMGWGAMQHKDLARRVPGLEHKINHLHNNLFQIAVELGYAGAIIWLAWMTQFLWITATTARDLRGRDPEEWLALGTMGSACGLLLNGLVEYNFGAGTILILFALLMGLSSVLRDAGRKIETPEKN